MNEQLPLFDPPQPKQPQPEQDSVTDTTDAIARSGDARNRGYDPNNRRVSRAAEDQGWGVVDTHFPPEVMAAPEIADGTDSPIPGHAPFRKMTQAEREIGRGAIDAIRRNREGNN